MAEQLSGRELSRFQEFACFDSAIILPNHWFIKPRNWWITLEAYKLWLIEHRN